MPGCIMAMAPPEPPERVFVYGGTILPGCIGHGQTDADIVTRLRSASANTPTGQITDKELMRHRRALPSLAQGRCGGMYTANTMASGHRGARHVAAELGRAGRRVEREDRWTASTPAPPVMNMIKRGITPRDIMTEGGLRERHHAHHRAGRLDQRRAASDRHGRTARA